MRKKVKKKSKGTILEGDCLQQMSFLPDSSIDAIVTDPPYGLEFMGKKWDKLQTSQWKGKRENWQDNHPDEHIGHRLAKHLYIMLVEKCKAGIMNGQRKLLE